ncbi:MAG TPA: transcriptional regulator [bacterium]|nr:transcriptional regulator [bacterium]
MLETQGRVISTKPGFAWVESARQGGCGSCASKGACGTQLLGEALSSSSSNQVLAQDPLGVDVGDMVLLGIAEEGALRAAFLMYGLPLLGFLLGILLAQPWGDLWATAAGCAGLGLALAGVWLLNRNAARRSPASGNTQPVVIARIASVPVGVETTLSKIIPIQKL